MPIPPTLRQAARSLGIAKVYGAARLWPYRAIERRDRIDNEHLRMLMAFLLKLDSNCIDIGANRGTVLERIVELAPAGLHWAVEPLPHLAADLRERFPAVTVKEVALSAEDGQAKFCHVLSNEAYSGFLRQWYPLPAEVTQIDVAVRRLDSILPPEYVPHFIKIDVEGAERHVIEGAIHTITRHKPVVVFEHFRRSALEYGTTPADLYALLVGEAGLRIFDIDGVGPYTLAALNDQFEKGTLWTFVARV